MITLPAVPSWELSWGFAGLSVLMAILVAAAFRRPFAFVLAGCWLLFWGLLADQNVLADFDAFPPRAPLVLATTLVGVLAIAGTKLARPLVDLPCSLLIGFQAFRVIVEILIHRGVVEGVTPVQMSWEGYNFDIVTGLTAIIVGPLASRLPRWVLLAWNTMGLGLLATVVTVAVLSLPVPFQQFHPDNVWIVFFPFVWLPSVLVAIALLGHLITYRKLLTPGPTPVTEDSSRA